MKKIPMLWLLAAPYLYIIICALKGLTGATLMLWPILFALILLPNMVYAFLLPRRGYTEQQLLFWDMLIKLLYIPVYLLTFTLVLMLHILILPLIPFLFLFDYSLLLASSMYGISGIYRSCQHGRLSKKQGAIHIMLHFFFCFDVFSAICCYVRYQRGQKAF